MGQQQLLLIILGTLVVGIAVAGGIILFRGGAVNAARDAVSLDVEELSARAQVYYRKPRVMGGGNRSFMKSDGSAVIGIMDITNTPINQNGRYYVDLSRSSADSIVIVGVGFEIVGADSVEVEAHVSDKTVLTIPIH